MPKIVFIISFALIVVSVVFINIKNQNENVLQMSTARTFINFPTDHGDHLNAQKEWWNINLEMEVISQNNNQSKKFTSLVSLSRVNHANKNFNNLVIGMLDVNSRFQNNFKPANSTGLLEVTNDEKLNVDFSTGSTTVRITESPESSNLSRFVLSGNTSVLENFQIVLSQGPEYKGPSLWGDGRFGVCNGLLSIFSNNDTLKYSIPGYLVSGTFRYNGENYRIVSGKGWLDHKWYNTNVDIENWNAQYYLKANFKDQGIFLGGIYNLRNRGTNFYGITRDSNGNSSCTSNGDIVSYSRTFYPRNLSMNFNDRFVIFNALRSSERYFYYFPGDAKPEVYVNYFSNVRYYIDDFSFINGSGFIETGIRRPDPNE
jgi:hypothetical protein